MSDIAANDQLLPPILNPPVHDSNSQNVLVEEEGVAPETEVFELVEDDIHLENIAPAPPPGSPVRAAPQQAVPEPADERQCRICLGGPEEEEELGRLITPCLCRGTIRYVHVQCLKSWREASLSKSAFWECPQCHFRYAFARTRALGLASSKIILGLATFVLFTAIVFLCSGIVSFFLPDPKVAITTPSSTYIDIDAGGYYYNYGFASEIIKYAVATFADIDISQLLGEQTDARRRPRIKNTPKGTRTGSFKKTIKQQRGESFPTKPNVVVRLLNRFIVGLSFLGIISFLQLLISMSLLGPIQFMRGTWLRRRRGEAGAAEGIGTVLIVLFVVVGVLRAVYQVYKLTGHLAQLLLKRAETAILEVDNPEARANQPREEWGVWAKRIVMQWFRDAVVALDLAVGRWREWWNQLRVGRGVMPAREHLHQE